MSSEAAARVRSSVGTVRPIVRAILAIASICLGVAFDVLLPRLPEVGRAPGSVASDPDLGWRASRFVDSGLVS